MSSLIDLTGQRIGRLTVIDRAETPANAAGRQARWLCECACGTQIVVRGDSLIRSHTTSCGCWKRESSSERCRARATAVREQTATAEIALAAR
jgi:hypothetical protein